MFDAEGTAVKVLESNGIDPENPVPGIKLAYCVLGADSVEFDPFLRVAARWDAAAQVIRIRPNLTLRRQNFCLAHEVAHVLLRHHLLYWPEFIEREADRLGTALLVPGPALRFMVRRHGRRLVELSEVFSVSESTLHLRLGEVLGSPLALVTPDRVHVRGDTIEWGREDDLRAKAFGRQPHEPWFDLVRFNDSRRNRGLVLRAA